MTELDRRIELEALITEREGMVAGNYQDCNGAAHDESEFVKLAGQMRKLKEEVHD
jgi:hypothetical protein